MPGAFSRFSLTWPGVFLSYVVSIVMQSSTLPSYRKIVWGISAVVCMFGCVPMLTAQESGQVTSNESKRLPGEETPEEAAAREAARKRGEYTFDDLVFDMEKGGVFKEELITDELRELVGKEIRIRGFILPTSVYQESGIQQFVLVRDDRECCFGPGAALYDCIFIDVDIKEGCKFTTRPVSVKGKFKIDLETFLYPDGQPLIVYRMVATEVK